MNKWVWLGSIFAVALFVYLTRGVMLPFMAGLAIAYFLDPVTDVLERRKVPRGAATAIVLAGFFTLIGGVIFAFWPIVHAQIGSIAETLPKTLANLRPWLNETLNSIGNGLGLDFASDAQDIFSGFSDEIFGKIKDGAAGVLTGSLALFNVLTLVLISPVVAFYLLRDWDLLVAKVDSWLPQSVAAIVREQFTKIDTVLAGFVRGQLLVSTTMGVLYGVGWSLVGLNFSIVLGVLAGVMSFVPFVGALFAAVIAVAIAVGQWGFDPAQIGLVALVFFVVQIIEGAFLTPRLVGERVGLHPVWVLFAVFAGGEVMGFLGVLIAVPAAAALAVLVRFWIDRYLEHYEIRPDVPIVAPETAIDDTEKLESEKSESSVADTA